MLDGWESVSMVIQAQDFRESAAMPSYILGRQLIVGWVACILLLSLLCLFLGSYEITPEIMVRDIHIVVESAC